MIIFDNNYYTFEMIITQMQVLKDQKITFKIIPKGCQYLIGSNFSDEKGSVVRW